MELKGLLRRAGAVGCKAVQGGGCVRKEKKRTSMRSAAAGRLGHSCSWRSRSGARTALGVQPETIQVTGDWWVEGWCKWWPSGAHLNRPLTCVLRPRESDRAKTIGCLSTRAATPPGRCTPPHDKVTCSSLHKNSTIVAAMVRSSINTYPWVNSKRHIILVWSR